MVVRSMHLKYIGLMYIILAPSTIAHFKMFCLSIYYRPTKISYDSIKTKIAINVLIKVLKKFFKVI